MSWLRGQWAWHITCRRIRWTEKLQLSVWRKLPRNVQDKFALWRMGQLSCADTLNEQEVGSITTDQYIRAMKEESS